MKHYYLDIAHCAEFSRSRMLKSLNFFSLLVWLPSERPPEAMQN